MKDLNDMMILAGGTKIYFHYYGEKEWHGREFFMGTVDSYKCVFEPLELAWIEERTMDQLNDDGNVDETTAPAVRLQVRTAIRDAWLAGRAQVQEESDRSSRPCSDDPGESHAGTDGDPVRVPGQLPGE